MEIECSEECYQRARTRAKNYIQAIRKTDEKFKSDIGEKLIEIQCEDYEGRV